MISAQWMRSCISISNFNPRLINTMDMKPSERESPVRKLQPDAE